MHQVHSVAPKGKGSGDPLISQRSIKPRGEACCTFFSTSPSAAIGRSSSARCSSAFSPLRNFNFFFSFILIHHHEAPFSSFRRIAHDSRIRHPQPDTRQQCVSQISLRSRLPGHLCQADDHHPRSSPQATSSCATPQSRTTPRARSTSSSPPARASGRSRPRPSRARGRPSGPCSRTAP